MGETLNIEDSESLADRVRARLDAAWATPFDASKIPDTVPSAIRDSIAAAINSRFKTYRYVLPTQLLSKLVDPSLDCRSVQKKAGVPGAFDARTVCHKVIVPFDRINNNVLGGSPEPYANNPLRIPAIVESEAAAQKDPDEFRRLVAVLEFAQNSPALVAPLVSLTLAAVRERLETVSVVYPIPNRISHERSLRVLSQFLSERSGGLRMQAVAVALFRTIGARFGLFSDVRSNSTNAADASTGGVADLECLGADGEIVMAVEVKDRQLELRHVQDKMPGVRAKKVAELLFLVQDGTIARDAAEIERTAEKEFAAGQNVYAMEWTEFLSSCLVLVTEAGRRELLQNICDELESRRADLVHRKAWAELLAGA